MYFFVILLYIKRQVMKKRGVCIQQSRTTLMGTKNLFKTFHLVNHIVMETRLAKIILMLTVTHIHSLLFVLGFFYLSFADLTYSDVFHVVYCLIYTVSEGLPNFRSFNFLLRTARRLRVFDLGSKDTLKCIWHSLPC